MNLLSESENDVFEVEKSYQEDERSSSTYNQPQNPRYKEDSVKASFLLELATKVPESHYNISILMNNLGLDKIKH